MCILDCKGSSNRHASWNESLETGDESVATRNEFLEVEKKHNNHVIIAESNIESGLLICDALWTNGRNFYSLSKGTGSPVPHP